MPLSVALVEKIYKTNKFYIERTLPDVGKIYVKKGDIVQPFTKVGETKTSFFFQEIDPVFKLTKEVDTYIEKGIQIGVYKRNPFRVLKLYAPYNGFIRMVGRDNFVFEQEKENFHLLAGIWGQVIDIVESKQTTYG